MGSKVTVYELSSLSIQENAGMAQSDEYYSLLGEHSLLP